MGAQGGGVFFGWNIGFYAPGLGLMRQKLMGTGDEILRYEPLRQ